MKRSHVSRRRRLTRLLVAAVVVAGLAFILYSILSGGTVVPGVTARLYPIHYEHGISRVADLYGLDPYLVAAIVHTESGYDPRAVSRAGAVGLMQLMPDTAEWITRLDIWRGKANFELTDPDDNLELGACYMAFLLSRFGGDTRAAVAAYNAGQGAVAEWIDSESGGDGLELSDIRFPETRSFVEKVERYWDLYTRAHPDLFVIEDGPMDPVTKS